MNDGKDTCLFQADGTAFVAQAKQAAEQARAAAETARLAQEKYDRDYAAWQEQVRLCRTGFRPACTARPAWVAPAQ